MSLEATTKVASRFFRGMSLIASLLLLAFPVALHGQKQEEFDEYKIRFDTGWFYSSPSGTIRAQGDTYPVDLTKDLSFNSYSTFAGKVDWKFTHKNHLYVGDQGLSLARRWERSSDASIDMVPPFQ
jgi:hypothetical protein